MNENKFPLQKIEASDTRTKRGFHYPMLDVPLHGNAKAAERIRQKRRGVNAAQMLDLDDVNIDKQAVNTAAVKSRAVQ